MNDEDRAICLLESLSGKARLYIGSTLDNMELPSYKAMKDKLMANYNNIATREEGRTKFKNLAQNKHENAITFDDRINVTYHEAYPDRTNPDDERKK